MLRMPRLRLAQLNEIIEIAKAVIEAWKSGKARKVFSVTDPDLIIEYLAVKADCQCEREIRGQYGARIKIFLPNLNLNAAPGNYWQEITSFVTGVLVQEATHHLQKQADEAGFKVAKKRQEEWKKGVTSLEDVLATEFLENYYDTSLEFEAHAAQVAIEAMLGEIPTAETRTWKRMARRLGSALDTKTEEDFGSRFLSEVERHRIAWLGEQYGGKSQSSSEFNST